MEKIKSPFKFLDSFTRKDGDYFFGRNKEISELYNMVFESPLILLYGLSGTGKTSLVQCGLANKFEGPDWLPFFIRRNENINYSLNSTLDKYIYDHKNRNLAEKVSYLSRKYYRPVYIIFDQLEELFILGNDKEKEEFVSNIKELLDAKLLSRIILIIREEYIGQLYDFESRIPSIFDFRLRVEPMGKKRAMEVIQSSCQQLNIDLEPQVANNIIDNVSKKTSGIQLPYLQVYLDKFYIETYYKTYPNGIDEKLPSLIFTEKEVDKIGNIDNVLESFLDAQKEELQKILENLGTEKIPPETVHEILNALITEDGTKCPIHFTRVEHNKHKNIIKIDAKYKNHFPKLSDSILSYAINSLDARRIIRFTENDTAFELAHDSLAQLINQKKTDQQRQRDDTLRSLKNYFNDYDKNKIEDNLLSGKKIDRYEDDLPSLSDRLGDDILNYIEKSRTHVEEVKKKKAEEKAEIKAGKVRKVLLPIIGVLLVLAIYGFWDAGVERNKVEQLSFEKQLSTAETRIAGGNFNQALKDIVRVREDLGNVRKYLGNFKEYEAQLKSNALRVDSLESKCIILKGLIEEGDRFMDQSYKDSANDTLLFKALKCYEEALEISVDKYVKGKKQIVEERINYRFLHWINKVENLVRLDTSGYGYAKEYFYVAKYLGQKPIGADVRNDSIWLNNILRINRIDSILISSR